MTPLTFVLSLLAAYVAVVLAIEAFEALARFWKRGK